MYRVSDYVNINVVHHYKKILSVKNKIFIEDFTEVFLPENYKKRGIAFFSAYDCETVIDCPTEKMKNLALKPKRICRFCGLKYGQVYFKKDAHIISKLLGNKHLLSDFECDNCNLLFSKYEGHLSQFIGPVRAFLKLYGSQTDYKFKSPDKKTIAENFDLYGLEKSFSITREDFEDHTFEINRETGEVKVNFIKQSYRPLLVYKSILKIALSSLPATELKNYKLAFKYLNSTDLDDKIQGVAKILIYTTPPGTGYNSPFGFVYKRKDEERKIVSHVFALYFMNKIYQIVIPLNLKDLSFYNSAEVEVLYSPPIFHNSEFANTVPILEQYLNMSSADLIKGEKETVGFKYDLEEYSKGVAFDTKSNEITNHGFKPNSILKLVFTPADSNIILPKKIGKHIT